jgi:hypothetical protein
MNQKPTKSQDEDRFSSHVDDGEKLKEIYLYVLELSVRTARIYGCNDAAAKKADAAYRAISSLRCALDSKVCTEHPNKPDREVTSIYYGESRD